MDTKGYNLGWEMAGKFITGTKSDRRKLRSYIVRTGENDGRFVTSFRDAVQHRFEDRSYAIRAGLAPRTVDPGKLDYFVTYWK